MEAIETALRSAMHQAGASALAQLLRYDPPDTDHRTIPCPCGHWAHYKELRSKTMLTVLGPVELRRPYYLCDDCSKGQYPADVELDIAGLESSPGVRRMQAMVGSEMPFAPGCEPMKVLAGLDVTAKAIERAAEAIGTEIAQQDNQEIGRAKQLVLPVVCKQNIPKMYVLMDGVQVPVVASETEGRMGRVEGQPARTRECKLGCVFIQTTVDPEGWPIRDADSTTYVGAIETAEEFGFRIYTEAWRRGWEWATVKVVIGDGAVWIWNLADQHFPGAIQIVDLYHARQHLWKIAALLHPHDPAAKKLWMIPMKDLLDDGAIEPLVTHLREIAAAHADAHPDLAEEVLKEAEYFATNASRMRYPEFRGKGLFVGSGVVEAGCKSVIGSRLKRSGMFWTVRGANAIIALRCCRINGRFEDYWEQHRAA
ncbi:MAG: ISKra4 family transposase [Acidobacteria bacterium]|nr:MAG: ISKra4 family transposase [Acidobacteriota bacterium]